MKLAFIGLGAIGKPMSKRLIDNGYDLNLYKRNKLNNDNQQKYFVDPIETVSDCEGLLICVTDDYAVDSVLFGANGVADSLKPNKTSSTALSSVTQIKRPSQSLTASTGSRKYLFLSSLFRLFLLYKFKS